MTLKYEVVIFSRNKLAHWRHGELHRIDGPANIWRNYIVGWHQYGVYHRDIGPAIVGGIVLMASYYHRGCKYDH